MTPSLPRHPYPHYPEASAAPEGGLPLQDLLNVLRRRRRVIFCVVVLLTGVATLIGYLITQTYTATALVVIEPQEEKVIDLEKVVQGITADAAGIETEIKLIQSEENLGRAVQALNLTADPHFLPPDGPAAESGGLLSFAAGWLPEAVAERLPDRWLIAAGLAAAEPVTASDDTEEADEALREQRVIETLRGSLKVAQSGLSYVLSVSYTATEPGRAARIANAVAEAYIEGQLEDKLRATARANAWLSERVEELRERVLASERAVEVYRAAQGLLGAGADSLGADGGTLNAQQMAALTARLIEARAERNTTEARLRRAQELRADPGATETLAEVLSSPLIVALRQQELELSREEANLSQDFGPRHPRIVQLQAEMQRIRDRIGFEVDNAIRTLENELALARSRQQAIEESLSEAKDRSALTGRAGVQLRELEREAASSRRFYETFLVRLKETEEQQQILDADARVIAPAKVPEIPSSPSPTLFAGVGFTASLVLGSILALLLEQLDDSLRTGRHVEQQLEVPSLGLVAKVTDLMRGERLHDYLIARPRSAYAEGVRGLYAHLTAADIDRPPTVILVTSALPGEGKTSLAASLATSAAQLQQRTLLIDFDLRCPCIGREFDVRPKAGVVEVLAGEAALEDAVQSDWDTGVDVLVTAHSHDNPTALLTSLRPGTLLREARKRYQYVVIDAPPVLGIADVKAVASQVDAIVFVVQWERTKRAAAQSAIKDLRDLAAPVVGAVLNQVDMKRHAYYAYGDAGQYYRRYSRYYVN